MMPTSDMKKNLRLKASIEDKEPPIFTGSDVDKLKSCLDALQTSHGADVPTISFNDTSQFSKNIHKVSDFLHTVISTQGQ